MGECFFWYRPTRVVPDKRLLNGCVCVFVCVYFPFSNFISFLIDGFLMKFGAFVVMKQGEPIRFSECTYFGYCGYVSLAVSPLFRNWSAFCRCGGQKLSVLFFETPCN